MKEVEDVWCSEGHNEREKERGREVEREKGRDLCFRRFNFLEVYVTMSYLSKTAERSFQSLQNVNIIEAKGNCLKSILTLF